MRENPIILTLQQLFNALPEQYKYITRGAEDCFYIEFWKNKPIISKDFMGRDDWFGSEEISINEDDNEEESLTIECSKNMCNHKFGQDLFVVKEFLDKPTNECIAFRENYK